jgi:hypothetical protein
VKYINSVVITDRERDVEVERMSRYILNEVETSRHLISIEILIANPIDWLYAACLEFLFFSRSTVQKLENIMMNIVCYSGQMDHNLVGSITGRSSAVV